jgi:hypothetical protein
MATDALSVVQAPVTKATTFQGASFDLGTRPPEVGLHAWVRVLVTAATSSTTNSAVFTVEGSTDNVNWLTIGGARFGDVLSLTTTPQSQEIYIPVHGFVRYVRLVVTITGAGVASVPYQGDFVLAAPS